jgi:phosphopantetheinyl transferase
VTGTQKTRWARIEIKRIASVGLDDTTSLLEADLSRLAALSHPHRQRQFIAGRALARRLICSLGDDQTVPMPIEVDAVGKPFLPRWPALHLSISHSGDWIACAVANVPIGLDIERINPTRSTGDLIEQVCSKEEQSLFESLSPDRRDRLFTELWTVKEAWLKRRGVSLDIGLMRDIRWKAAAATSGNCASWITSDSLAVTVLGPPAESFEDLPHELRSVTCTTRQVEEA